MIICRTKKRKVPLREEQGGGRERETEREENSKNRFCLNILSFDHKRSGGIT